MCICCSVLVVFLAALWRTFWPRLTKFSLKIISYIFYFFLKKLLWKFFLYFLKKALNFQETDPTPLPRKKEPLTFQEMKLFSPPREKVLCFRKWKPLKNSLHFLKRKLFLYFWKREPSKNYWSSRKRFIFQEVTFRAREMEKPLLKSFNPKLKNCYIFRRNLKVHTL